MRICPAKGNSSKDSSQNILPSHIIFFISSFSLTNRPPLLLTNQTPLSSIPTISWQMAMFIRPKRVSDPLDDRAKARLTTGYASSGSEHSADDSCIDSSLVHAFFDLDQESADKGANAWPDSASDGDSNGSSRIAEAIEAVHGLLLSTSKESQRLCRDVSEAAEASAGLSSNRSLYRRRLMARLREAGYNAGICKAKWESSGGLTAGSYEYIDVPLRTNDHDDDRYIVDSDFASQFVIARSTTEYEELVALLPDTIIARAETVRRLVRIVAEAARTSLKSRDLSVPPWRKRRYMMAKWFGPYRRTVNPLPSSAGAEVDGRREVEYCRAVGFWSGTQRTVVPLRGTR